MIYLVPDISLKRFIILHIINSLKLASLVQIKEFYLRELSINATRNFILNSILFLKGQNLIDYKQNGKTKLYFLTSEGENLVNTYKLVLPTIEFN